MLTRRNLALGAGAMAIVACTQSQSRAETTETAKVTDVNANIDWANLSDQDWKARLTDMEYRVLRHEGTERPFSSPLNDIKKSGTYACAGCGLPLFTSDKKFDSGTGWPSFFDVIPDAVGTKVDRKLFVARTEYHCSRCGGHQGHVFKDGPAPTGLRYCNNGVALKFIEA